MEELLKYREMIEEIDNQIIDLLVKRMECSLKIGRLKKENNLPIFDPKREETLRSKNLSNTPAQFRKAYSEVLDAILKVSKDLQL